MKRVIFFINIVVTCVFCSLNKCQISNLKTKKVSHPHATVHIISSAKTKNNNLLSTFLIRMFVLCAKVAVFFLQNVMCIL